MKITPLDIEQKKFSVKFRGFDREEVLSFLELVREEMEELMRNNSFLREELAKAVKELKDCKETEASLKNVLVSTQRMVEEFKVNAEKEASQIKKEAEFHANRLLESVQQKVAVIKSEINDLEVRKRCYQQELKNLIEGHLRMLGFNRNSADAKEETQDKETVYRL
jgi:cell division initiation protein